MIEKHIELSDTQKKLVEEINKAANLIAKKSRSGSADFVVVSSDTANKLERINIEIDAININNDRSKKLKDILDGPDERFPID